MGDFGPLSLPPLPGGKELHGTVSLPTARVSGATSRISWSGLNLRQSLPNSANRPTTLDAISAHAGSLDKTDGAADLTAMHAEVCSRRQIEIKDQELRSFVVKQSVIRIHCVVAFALVLIAAELFGLFRADARGNALVAFIAVASLAIATSTRTIGRAVAQWRN